MFSVAPLGATCDGELAHGRAPFFIQWNSQQQRHAQRQRAVVNQVRAGVVEVFDDDFERHRRMSRRPGRGLGDEFALYPRGSPGFSLGGSGAPPRRGDAARWDSRTWSSWPRICSVLSPSASARVHLIDLHDYGTGSMSKSPDSRLRWRAWSVFDFYPERFNAFTRVR